MLAEAMARCYFDGEPPPDVFELVLSNGARQRVARWAEMGAERAALVRFEFPEGATVEFVDLVADGKLVSRVVYDPAWVVPPGGDLEFGRSFGVTEKGVV